MDKNSLSHASWECVYHVVWIPKYSAGNVVGKPRGKSAIILQSGTPSGGG